MIKLIGLLILTLPYQLEGMLFGKKSNIIEGGDC